MLLDKVFKPFGIFEMAVRNNCPWHRKSYTPAIHRMNVRQKLKIGSVEGRLKSIGGRQILMRRLLLEKPFLGWGYDARPKETRISYPL